jgi:hypothetical protein
MLGILLLNAHAWYFTFECTCSFHSTPRLPRRKVFDLANSSSLVWHHSHPHFHNFLRRLYINPVKLLLNKYKTEYGLQKERILKVILLSRQMQLLHYHDSAWKHPWFPSIPFSMQKTQPVFIRAVKYLVENLFSVFAT